MGAIREILGSGTWMAGLHGLLPFRLRASRSSVIPTSVRLLHAWLTDAPLGGFFVCRQSSMAAAGCG